MNIVKIFFTIFFYLGASDASSGPLTLENVLLSTDKYFPEIKASLKDIESSEQDKISKEGSFDTSLEIEGLSREKGYYSGDFVKVKLKKNLPIYGVKVHIGYKVSEGSFPVYEGERETLDNGEISAGFSVPLLRNREIDKSRLNVFLATNKINKKKIKLLQKRVKAREKAMKAYWTWLATGKVKDIYKRLLNIAEKRQVALEKKHKRGDVAKIYLSENRQYILKRQNKYLEAKNYFQNAARNLAIFNRDEKGKPHVPKEESLNTRYLFEEANKDHNYESYVEKIIQVHPDIKNIQNKIRRYEILEKEARVGMLPVLDFGFQIRKDNGTGVRTLKGEDRRFGLNFSLPFENRKAKGRFQSSRIMQRSFSFSKQLLEEKINLKLRNLIDTINTFIKVFKNGQSEVRLAIKLEEAEQAKFFQGDSDFFVVNLREQMTAEAQISNVISSLKVNKLKAQIQSLALVSNLDEEF